MEGFTQYTVEDYARLDDDVLRQQRVMLTVKVHTARKCLEDGDPRAQEALDYFLAQRKLCNEALRRADSPPPQEIGLETLAMSGKSTSGNDVEQLLRRQFLKLFGGNTDG